MARKQPKYSWETQHDTAANTMKHTFTERVAVVSNTKKGEVLVKVDGNIVNTYYGMSVKVYERLLLAVEQYAYKLQRKDNVKQFLCKVAVYAIMLIEMLAFIALCGENDEWSLGMFAAQKVGCFAVMVGCYYSVKLTPALAAAWRNIDNSIKE